eukprot:TRINITY_DN64478_c1_g1_i1.p1 TRINITY_DN64478_c1_g1~~TRINITY_DN64478_c1_g1_i1.p1  ORF type:complete len:797 (+),score=87.75 TRINITY_DN64478_c1_g1_i1:1023-3413(+)
MLGASIIAFIVGMCHLIAAYSAHEFDADLDSKLGKAEGMCFAQALFSAITVTLSCAAISTLESTGDTLGMCSCFFNSLYMLGIASGVLAFVNFVALYYEHKLAIRLLALLTGLLAVGALAIGGIAMFQAATIPTGEKSAVCNDHAFAALSRDYMAHAGCPLKYKATSQFITELACPKKDIKYVWEENFADTPPLDSLDVYGCINRGCCEVIMADLKIIFWNAAASAILLGLILAITAWTAYRYQFYVKELGRMYMTLDDLLKGGHLLVLVSIIISLVVLSTVTARMRPVSIPDTPAYMEADKLPAGTERPAALGKFAPLVNPEYIKGSFQLTNYTLVLDRKSCEPFCDEIVYHVTVTGPADGELTLEPEAYKNKDVLIDKEDGQQGKVVKFKCWFKDANPMLRLLRFRPGDFTRRAKIIIDIKARQEPDFKDELQELWGGDRRLRLLDNDFYKGENPLQPIFRKEINFEIFSTEYTTIYTGKIIYKDPASGIEAILPNVSIEVTSPQLDDKLIYEGIGSEEGVFNIPLSLLIMPEKTKGKVVPYAVNAKFTKSGYTPLVIPLTVGGHGAIKEYDLGTYLMVPVYTSKGPITVTGTVLDTTANKGVENAKVVVHDSTSNETTTNDKGEFKFTKIEYCGNMLEASKKDYYLYKKPAQCEGNKTEVSVAIPLTPIISGYKLRTVLTWKGLNEDLDLNARFFKTKEIECKVGHTLERCGGAIYRGDFSRKNVTTMAVAETLDLNTVGPYQYIFYVEDFAYQKVHPLSRSKAHVDVYSGYYPEGPVVSLDVPQYEHVGLVI